MLSTFGASGDGINFSTIRNAYASSIATTGVPVLRPLSQFGTGENETYDVAIQCECALYIKDLFSKKAQSLEF